MIFYLVGAEAFLLRNLNEVSEVIRAGPYCGQSLSILKFLSNRIAE